MKIRVEIDITRPLKKFITTVNFDSSNLLLAVKYEKLLDLCYKCWMVSHFEKDCMETWENDMIYGCELGCR